MMIMMKEFSSMSSEAYDERGDEDRGVSPPPLAPDPPAACGGGAPRVDSCGGPPTGSSRKSQMRIVLS